MKVFTRFLGFSKTTFSYFLLESLRRPIDHITEHFPVKMSDSAASKATTAHNNSSQQQQQENQTLPTAAPRSPHRSPRAAAIPEAQLREWEKLQVQLAAQAEFTDAKLGWDPSSIFDAEEAAPATLAPVTAASGAPAVAAATPGQSNPLANTWAAIATRGLTAGASDSPKLPSLRWVGGLDISFVKDTSIAVASLVVLDVSSLDSANKSAPAIAASKATGTAAAAAASANKNSSIRGQDAPFPVVYEDMLHCTMNVPYVPGYLAFREVEPLRQLIKRIKERAPQFLPQVYFVDGNGVHHFRKCGLATHFGVLENVAIVGVAKNLLNVDGLSRDSAEKLVLEVSSRKLQPGIADQDGNFVYRGTTLAAMRGASGFLYGYGALTGNSTTKPVYISPGTNISFRTAAKLAVRLAPFRVVEPIRQADLRSRKYIAENLTISTNDGGDSD